MLGQTPYDGRFISPFPYGNNIALPQQPKTILINDIYEKILDKDDYAMFIVNNGLGEMVTLQHSTNPHYTHAYSIGKDGKPHYGKDSYLTVDFSTFEIELSEVLKVDFEIDDMGRKIVKFIIKNDLISRKIVEMYAKAYKNMIQEQEETAQSQT